MAVIERPFKKYLDGTVNEFGDINKSYYGEDCYKWLEEHEYSDDVINSVGCVVYDGNEPLIIVGVEECHEFSDHYWICLDINKDLVRRHIMVGDKTTITFE